MAIASDNMVFYYMARDNLCFLTLCEEAYPKRLAFLYLDDIADTILQELLNEFGVNVSLYLFPRRDAFHIVCLCQWLH
jgi:vesicle transport protein SEC22